MDASASTPAAAADQAKAENGAIRSYDVDIPQEDLDDLRRRIAATRWPSKELVADRSQGVATELESLRRARMRKGSLADDIARHVFAVHSSAP